MANASWSILRCTARSKNIERDPRVTLTIRDEQNPYRYAEAGGEIVEIVRGQEARHHIDNLSQKYSTICLRSTMVSLTHRVT